MGGGRYGGFRNTRGAAAGDASFMHAGDEFFRYIQNRKDIDPGGVFDIIAHGTSIAIEVKHVGSRIMINSRIAAQLISRLPNYRKGQAIRLLSCNTGADDAGFAQNLANKLNVVVYAPAKTLWAWPDGSHLIADKSARGGPNGQSIPDMNSLGTFRKFVPGGNL
jgi:hypothetical protein